MLTRWSWLCWALAWSPCLDTTGRRGLSSRCCCGRVGSCFCLTVHWLMFRSSALTYWTSCLTLSCSLSSRGPQSSCACQAPTSVWQRRCSAFSASLESTLSRERTRSVFLYHRSRPESCLLQNHRSSHPSKLLAQRLPCIQRPDTFTVHRKDFELGRRHSKCCNSIQCGPGSLVPRAYRIHTLPAPALE